MLNNNNNADNDNDDNASAVCYCDAQLSDYQGSQYMQQPPVETIVGGK